MVLIIDLTNDRLAFGAADGRTGSWLSLPPSRGVHAALDQALKKFGLDRRPAEAVVLVKYGAAEAAGRISWSLVRAGVALANTLAFAWNVPVASLLRPAGVPDGQALAAAAWKLSQGARTGEWAGAVYSGEPNITRSKKTL